MSTSDNRGAAKTTEEISARALARPDLLAPAGDWECAKAAVENGADAIYFGLERFNARMRAHNFTEADMPKLMEFLHRRGVKGYVTFNTLVFANEMAEAEQHLRAIIAAGVDAAIVQDVGICRLIRQISPDFPIHASTQMTVTSAAGVEFARELGCNLVVLARECSLKEIEKIQGFPLEVFVHGALCVAYSGQCLTSEALGGRSANRGECAQACRMPYELLADGQLVPLGDRRYLLSPQDLAGLELLPELIQAGVASLKIEGRLKTAEYVANITRVYRQALDKVFGELTQASTGCGDGPSSPRRAEGGLGRVQERTQYEMEMAFSRGLYTGWLRGSNNQELVHARFGKKRGVFLGEVSRLGDGKVFVRLQGPLKLGDGVVFDAGHPDQPEEGGRVYAIKTRGSESALEFGRGDIDFHRIQVGDKLWKTSDPELDRGLRQTFAGDQPRFQRPLDLEVHGEAGEPMTIVARDASGLVVEVSSAMPLTTAEKQPLDTARLREQLGRLGGTPFHLGELLNQLEGELILPVSELNRLRRDMVSQLETVRGMPRRWTLECGVRNAECGMGTPESGVGSSAAAAPWRDKAEYRIAKGSDLESEDTEETRRDLCAPRASAVEGVRPFLPQRHEERKATQPQPSADEASALHSPGVADLIVLVRSLAQLEAALICRVQTVYCEFEDPKKYREAVHRFREWQGTGASPSSIIHHPSSIYVAPPRIFKAGEEWILRQVRSCEADGYLVRNYDHLRYFADARCVGDFCLNVANGLTAEYFMKRFGLERVTASYDLNFVQLEALLQSAPAEWFEVAIHQHMPMFHMEHCLFCAFLTSGTDYTNCGRPCDHREVKLRDRVGAEHVVKADAGCRNTVFNARAQTGAEYVARMLGLGARHFRIEFVSETPEEVAQTISQYRRLLRGEITGAQLWRDLKLVRQLGVTRGPMEKLG